MNGLASALPPSRIRVGVVASNYHEAIHAAGAILVEAGHALPEYSEAMVRVVEELGPYIVITEGVALAHAAPAGMVSKSGLSLVALESAVDFGSGKMVSLVFALAALDHDAHIVLMGELANLLADVETVNIMLNATSSEQIHELMSSVTGE